jgi:hypothetical protein
MDLFNIYCMTVFTISEVLDYMGHDETELTSF